MLQTSSLSAGECKSTSSLLLWCINKYARGQRDALATGKGQKSNSPSFAPWMKADHSSGLKVRVVFVESFVSRTPMSPLSSLFTDTQNHGGFVLRVLAEVKQPSSSTFWPSSLTVNSRPSSWKIFDMGVLLCLWHRFMSWQPTQ